MKIYTAKISSKNNEFIYSSDIEITKPVVSRILKQTKLEGEVEYKKRKYSYQILGDMVSFVDQTFVDQLEKLAWVDQLTGAYNRHAYWKTLEEMIYECSREEKDFGLIFVDIDNLKGVNTKVGYIGGDETIAGIAKIVIKRVRKNDHVFRMGGDEFLVFAKFKTGSKIGFNRLVSRIHASIEAKSKKYSTASIGGILLNNKRVIELEKTKTFKKDWTIIMKELSDLEAKVKEEGRNSFKVKA